MRLIPFCRCIIPTDQKCPLVGIAEDAPEFPGDDTLKVGEHFRVPIAGYLEESFHRYAAIVPGESFEAPPVIVRQPVHELHGEIAIEVDGFPPLLLASSSALPDLQKASAREVADELLLRIGREAPKIAGLDDESHVSCAA